VKRRTFVAGALFAAFVPGRAGALPVYPAVIPGGTPAFPRDHGAHHDYRTEWWYVTGHLASAGGRAFGFQVTFFRSRPGVAEGSPSRFAARQLILAHAALADPARPVLVHDQRAARAGFELAGADAADTRTWIGDWSLVRAPMGYRARVAARSFGLDLRLSPTQPVLLQGEDGFSRKGPDPRQASWYYSQPQLAVEGSVDAGNGTLPVSGRAWLDHEWSSEILAADAAGWDWLGANLDDGSALMAFVMRDRQRRMLWAAATLRDAAGTRRTYAPGDVRFAVRRRWRSPRTGIDYPVAVDVTVGDRRYAVEPWFDDQELDARASTGTIYWEGAVDIASDGRRAGRGYLELTGYGEPLRM
jgi:predicted secreted hydrolase